MKILPFAATATAVMAGSCAVLAQETYKDSGNPNVSIPSVVQKYLNAAGMAIPVSSGQCAAPAQVALPGDTMTSGAITARDTASVTTVGYNGFDVVTGTPTAGSAVAQSVNGISSATITIAGSFTGTLEFEVSGDGGTTYVASTARQRGSGGTAGPATITATGIGVFDIDLASKTNVRVRATAAMTGSASVKINQSATTGPIEIQTPVRIQDNNSDQNLTIKPASTTPAAADPAAVVAISPNTAEVGTPATGYAQPSGGVGLSGWLSGIYHSIANTLAVNIGQSGTAGDATMTTGGTAQNLFGGATPANGFSVANPNAADDCWISDSVTAAANGKGSYRLAANGGEYDTPPAYRPVGPVSALCPTTGDVLTARRW